MSEVCCDELDFGDTWWFICSEKAGHVGPHLAKRPDDQDHMPYYRIEWAQRPKTVRGEVA